MHRFLASLIALLLALMALIGWTLAVRPGLDREAALRYAAPPAPGALRATWLGTAAILLADEKSAIFIDPFYSRPPGLWPLLRNASITPDDSMIRAGLASAGISTLDAVLVSHAHYDHAMDAPRVAQLTGAVLAGSPSTINIGRGEGMAEAQLRTVTAGEPFQAGAFRITFIESRHAGASGGRPTGDIDTPLVPPARYLDYRQGGTYSILIEHPQGTMLHQGSAGFVPGAIKGRKADLVFLGISLLPKLDDYLREVVDATGAKRVVPMHWDDFTRSLNEPLRPLPRPLVNLPKFFDGMQARPDLSVETYAPGQAVALFPRAAR